MNPKTPPKYVAIADITMNTTLKPGLFRYMRKNKARARVVHASNLAQNPCKNVENIVCQKLSYCSPLM